MSASPSGMRKKTRKPMKPSLILGILGLYRGYIGIMEKKMETTGIIGVILG